MMSLTESPRTDLAINFAYFKFQANALQIMTDSKKIHLQ
jgi:hypothetical protein